MSISVQVEMKFDSNIVTLSFDENITPTEKMREKNNNSTIQGAKVGDLKRRK